MNSNLLDRSSKKIYWNILQVSVGESAKNIAGNPDVKKIQIIITPADKEDSYKPVKLQLSIHACFERRKFSCTGNTKVFGTYMVHDIYIP